MGIHFAFFAAFVFKTHLNIRFANTLRRDTEDREGSKEKNDNPSGFVETVRFTVLWSVPAEALPLFRG